MSESSISERPAAAPQAKSDEQAGLRGDAPAHAAPTPVAISRVSGRALKIAAGVGAGALLLVLAVGAASRQGARHDLATISDEAAVPSVTVVRPTAPQAAQQYLPGRLQAWSEAPVYARTNGYLRRWYADIGDHVRPGQLLADIDTPEVDQQLIGATAALATAAAERKLAATTTERWDRLVAQNAVSKQDADERRGAFAARQAMENEAAANVSRLKALTGFKRIVAPFEGVVTSRATDVGALIVAGDARTTPLFTVADTHLLRLYVSVPQSLAATITPGEEADFQVPDHPGQTYKAKVVRTSGAVDAASGAMLVQLVFDNGAGLLKPGAYATVDLHLSKAPAASPAAPAGLRIPASALIFRREGAAVAVVDAQGRVTIRPIVISQDFGTELAVASGLSPGDWIVDSPSDAIANGDRVKANAAKSDPHADA
jgi:RND family efflux transporter MFP subunit